MNQNYTNNRTDSFIFIGTILLSILPLLIIGFTILYNSKYIYILLIGFISIWVLFGQIEQIYSKSTWFSWKNVCIYLLYINLIFSLIIIFITPILYLFYRV